PQATIIGIPYDAKSSFLRGPALAPTAIRTALRTPAGNSFSESLYDVDSPSSLGDAGDVPIESDEYPLDAIQQAVIGVLNSDSVPIALGGDHSISYAVVRAIAKVAKPFTILHFDAHSDLYDSYEGDRLSHACPFARIMEEQLATHLVQVGIRCMTPPQRIQADRFHVEVIDMRAWIAGVRPKVVAPCYLSIDLDVLDPAFAPGLSHREPGGLSTRDVISLIQGLQGPVVGADIVELNPARDVDGMTALVAAKILKELVSLIAVG
ncbi:MAG: agmatinase, partial [Gemmatimonadaceae bacterium]